MTLSTQTLMVESLRRDIAWVKAHPVRYPATRLERETAAEHQRRIKLRAEQCEAWNRRSLAEAKARLARYRQRTDPA